MLKRILYAIVIIAIIVVLAIMWTDSKNKKDIQLENQAITTEDTNNNALQTETSASMSDELDKVDVNSGIDSDISSMDTDIKSL